jgi:hypothetical protein
MNNIIPHIWVCNKVEYANVWMVGYPNICKCDYPGIGDNIFAASLFL